MRLERKAEFNLDQIQHLIEKLAHEGLEEWTREDLTKLKESVLFSLDAFKNFRSSLHHFGTLLCLDERGFVDEWDDQFINLSNYQKAELEGFSFDQLLTDDERNADFFQYWNEKKWENVFVGDLSFKHKNNQVFWMKTTILPQRDDNNELESVAVFGVDTTDYKQKENQLTGQYQDNFTQTIDALINLVFKVFKTENHTYQYALFEGRLARDLKLTTDRLRGKELKEIFGWQKASFYQQKYEQCFKGKVVSYKHLYKGRFFYTTLSPVRKGGEVVEIIGSSVEITSYEKAENRIQHMAFHDTLTDLPNRSKLQKDLSEQLHEKGRSFGLMFCNLDRFKYVNDAMGHLAGDHVIRIMAERINKVLSSEDQLYRLGGDEFMIRLGDYRGRKDIRQLGKQLLQQISSPIHLMGRQLFLTASISVALYPEDAATADELIAHTDVAMHQCKMNGRQNMLFYTPKMNQYHNQMLSMEGALHEAISNNELCLFYQPKVDVKTGFISGMEALIRWVHPEEGYISPGKFIPIAEETGLIEQIDEWVLYEACRQSRTWIAEGFAPERVAVNVSANEFQRKNFAEKIHRILKETQLEPQFLEIEITENSVMRNTEACIKTMQDLKALGVSLAIDDFGTGYSSLSYLRQFPIHYLKVDQTFIKGVLHDPSDAEIVKAMIQLADAFKLEVIAEGVEDEEVLEFLMENHCSYYQGFHFSKPLPPEEMKELLTKKQTYSS
ncbi:EAL domain-containing protein [Halobacillus sp. BBL2006]|uniref:sensor domain-containing protein n=1 Tax=Halobacillus sp. BBL2006 TaxID=1543706 RepID=UPI000544035B|nr:EAL domain-containing protein [Halobacillus sp. BBL2006]KHE72700.1 hypothetical protein LD39_03230 [Halobacillus sp. BBL2006]